MKKRTRSMNENLERLVREVYEPCALIISDIEQEKESIAYAAFRYKVNGLSCVSRDAKITPKKVGQFVTCWKRNEGGTIEAFCENDELDFFCVNVVSEKSVGQFVFPKSVLIDKGILSHHAIDGKRAFRVYPAWDVPQNKTAEKTQKWQLNYFYELNNQTDLNRVLTLYQAK